MKRTIIFYIGPAANISVMKMIPKNARVGIFPLHLDPPTIYHQQLFKMLVASPETFAGCGVAGGEEGGVEGGTRTAARGGGLVNNNSTCRHHTNDNSSSSSSSSSSSASSAANDGQQQQSSSSSANPLMPLIDPTSPTPRITVPSVSSPTFNAGSTTASPYGEDWDTEALSRFARRRRLLSLLKEYKKQQSFYSSGSSGNSSASSSRGGNGVLPRSNRNQNNYVNTNTIRSRAMREEIERQERLQKLHQLQQQQREAEAKAKSAAGGTTLYGGVSSGSEQTGNSISSSSGSDAPSSSSSSASSNLSSQINASSELFDPEDFLTEDEIIDQLKRYVIASWEWSSDNRNSSYGGLATALRDEIFLDSITFGCEQSSSEKELLALLQEQQFINEEAYAQMAGGGSSHQPNQKENGGPSSIDGGSSSSSPNSKKNHPLFSNKASSSSPLAGGTQQQAFSAYDVSQAHTRQLLHKRRLPCQTESEISEQCRISISASSLAPFDHLIILPNSKYPAPIQQSRHLAAMASLSVRNLHPRVHMELYLLEHPEHNDTAVRDLTNYFTNATLIHWLPNIADIQMWRGYTEMMNKVPMLVLRPKGFHFPGSSSLVASSASSPTASSSSSAAASPSSVNGKAAASSFSHRSNGNNSDNGNALISDGASSASTSSEAGAGNSADVSESQQQEQQQCAVSTSPAAAVNQQIAKTLMSRLNAQRLEVLEIERLSGAGVRQLLWDRGTRHEEHGVIPPVVLRYMDSHGLYRDFRKGFAQSEHSLASQHSSHKRNGKVATSSFQATVALASLIPRLEIHYDKKNLVARQQYEKLKNFECRDGQDPDLIVPIGGDGYMMHCIRQNWHRFVPFFGVNAGHRGYLLNEPKRLEELFSLPLKLYHMPMLYCEAEVAVVSNNASKSSASSSSSSPLNISLDSSKDSGFTVEEARAAMAKALRPSVTGANKTSQSFYMGGSSSDGGDGASGAARTPIMSAYANSADGSGTTERISFGTNGTMLSSSSTSGSSSPIIDSATREREEEALRRGGGGGGGAAAVNNNKPTIHFETRTELAFNDAWVDRATGQTAWIRVIVNNTEQLKCVRGDGVLVSTAAGSTAYAQALGASPIPADVQLIQLVGSNIVSPSRWRPVHLNQSDSITLEVIDVDKRPCKCFVDSNCLGIAKSLKVRTSRVASVQLAFCHSYDLQQKLYQVQFPKEDDW